MHRIHRSLQSVHANERDEPSHHDEPPTRIGFRETLRWFGSDMMEARPEYVLEADGDTTVVHHVAVGELFGVMRLVKPVAALLARGERERTVASLKRSLEADRSPDRHAPP